RFCLHLVDAYLRYGGHRRSRRFTAADQNGSAYSQQYRRKDGRTNNLVFHKSLEDVMNATRRLDIPRRRTGGSIVLAHFITVRYGHSIIDKNTKSSKTVRIGTNKKQATARGRAQKRLMRTKTEA